MTKQTATALAQRPRHASDFESFLTGRGCQIPRRRRVTTLQLNVGKRCNLACLHCHVEAGPKRREAITRAVAERVLELLETNPAVELLDLTGGAPELSEHFRFLVTGARDLGRRVVDRCNLTVFFEAGQEDTPEFLAQQRAEIVASLPCYTAENVEKQRGRGVFEPSIEALRRLNDLGYADPDSGLTLDLVYNPLGPSLPPRQEELERDYREQLRTGFGIEFNRLITLANMPIKRFAHALERQGRYDAYRSLLLESFNPATLPGLMCRDLISVDHEGRIYDCDFNQALGMQVPEVALDIWKIDDLSELEGRPITTASHCFGCTAGAGSSCGGALT